MRSILYLIVKTFFRIFYGIYNRLEVRGADRLPCAPAIIASNHASNIDPPLVGSVYPTKLRYLAKEQLFKNPIFGGLISALGAIPVRREDSQRAGVVMKMLLERLAEGENILVFPEGSRSRDGRLQPLEGGAAFLSVKSGAPIVPVYISGSFDVCPPGSSLPRPVKLRVRFGEPIYPAADGSDKERREISMRSLESALRGMEAESAA